MGYLFDLYHDVSIEGLDLLGSEAALIVGNHNGGILAPDMFALMYGHWTINGLDAPAYGLMHDFIFRVPVIGQTMAKLGAVPANPGNAETLLSSGAKVLVYPGGDLDAYKASRNKHQIIFGERYGFIRIAIRCGVPIVPVVSIGAHDGFIVLTDGARIAEKMGLKKYTRIEVMPIALGFPWGLGIGPLGYLPPPLRMRIKVMSPIAWPELKASDASDDRIVKKCRDEVECAMQKTIEEMSKDTSYGIRFPWQRASAKKRYN
jgi:1-acyl-sn-glycerol-3-phosphate acyltransferase